MSCPKKSDNLKCSLRTEAQYKEKSSKPTAETGQLKPLAWIRHQNDM
jgi:hypothetical protein